MMMSATHSIDHIGSDENVAETADELQHRGLAHLQDGEWEAAIECFSELAQRCPENEVYANLLAEARMKARLGDSPPQRRTARSALHSRWVWAFLLANLALWLGVAGQKLYAGQIVPTLQKRQAAIQRQKLLEEGRQLLIAGNLEQAEGRYMEVLTQSPDNPTAQAALQEINRRRQLASLYEKVLSLVQQEQWDSALKTLETIRQEDPGFRDVQDQIERVRKTREQAKVFEEAKRLLESGDPQKAAEQLLLLKETAPDFKPEAVNQLLVKSYMKQAEAQVSAVVQHATSDIDQLQVAIGDLSERVRVTTREIEQLKEAIGVLTRAMEISPSDPNVAREHQLAQEYLAGLEAYRRGNWELASMHLADVYPMAPAGSRGQAARLLQAAFVQSGSRYFKRQDYQRAAEKYRQAIALGLTGDGRAMPGQAKAMLQKADRLLRQEQYREAAAAYGDILITMNFPVVTSTGSGPRNSEPSDEELLKQQIHALNNESERGEATPGQVAQAQEGTVGVEPTATPAVEIYVVRPNDTLGEIARRFDTTVDALLGANSFIQDRNLIRPGWRLLIPPT